MKRLIEKPFDGIYFDVDVLQLVDKLLVFKNAQISESIIFTSLKMNSCELFIIFFFLWLLYGKIIMFLCA